MPFVSFSDSLLQDANMIFPKQYWSFWDKAQNMLNFDLDCSSPLNHVLFHRGGGGVLRFELNRGVLLEPQNPYPSLRVILAKKGTHFFKEFSFKNRRIFQKFRYLAKTPKIT